MHAKALAFAINYTIYKITRMIGRYNYLQGSLLLLVIISANSFSQESFDEKRRSLDIITDTAQRICLSVQQSGELSVSRAEGSVKLELQRLTKLLGDAGIGGSLDFSKNKYEGVLQQDLPFLMKNIIECRLEVFRRLQYLIQTETERTNSSLNKTGKASELSQRNIIGIQKILNKSGLNVGLEDGVLGNKTRLLLDVYASSSGIILDFGKIDENFIKLLSDADPTKETLHGTLVKKAKQSEEKNNLEQAFYLYKTAFNLIKTDEVSTKIKSLERNFKKSSQELSVEEKILNCKDKEIAEWKEGDVIGDRIFFAFERYDLSSDALKSLEKISALMTRYEKTILRISGHVDQREKDLIGKLRSEAAKKCLLKLGIDEKRLFIIESNKLNPQVPGDNPIAYSQNRVVIFKIFSGN